MDGASHVLSIPLREKKLLETEGDAHTHTHGRFAALNLNSHLTSLRKGKRTGNRKAQKKRVGAKVCRSAARAANYGSSRYLKSLRKEREKDRKSKAKRSREKDRGSEKRCGYLALDYLALD